jgi:hypothetical protein
VGDLKMNMANNGYLDQETDQDDSRGAAPRGGVEKINRPGRRPAHKTKSAPSAYNGMHRRRNKRTGW